MSISFNKDSSNTESNNEKGRTNMSISLEQIDLIMKRSNVGYTQA